MKISEVYPDYVLSTIGGGAHVVAVDFGKQEYLDLEARTLGQIRRLIETAKASGSIKFFQFTE